jgi:hypothetical protein
MFKKYTIVLALIGAGIAVYVYRGWNTAWPERPDAATGVAVEVHPRRQLVRLGDRPALVVDVVNNGNKEVTLVQPGDGSQTGHRTPHVRWSNDGQIMRTCGNMAALKASEIFSLRPGERKRLDWVAPPSFDRPGKYLISFHYRNDRSIGFRGELMGSHEPGAIERLQSSTPVSAYSNAVEILVEN